MILFVFARFLEGGRNPEVVVVVFYLFADILIVQWPIRTTAKKQNGKKKLKISIVPDPRLVIRVPK